MCEQLAEVEGLCEVKILYRLSEEEAGSKACRFWSDLFTLLRLAVLSKLNKSW